MMNDGSGNSRGALFGMLRDEGYKPVIVNRLEELLDSDEFKGDFEAFCSADHTRLVKAYNALNPDGSKGLGAKTFRAFDRLVYLRKQAKFDLRQLAKATAAEQERREQEREAMRLELLSKPIDLEQLMTAMSAIGATRKSSCTLEFLLQMYDFVTTK